VFVLLENVIWRILLILRVIKLVVHQPCVESVPDCNCVQSSNELRMKNVKNGHRISKKKKSVMCYYVACIINEHIEKQRP
jgi:hypothetical protein